MRSFASDNNSGVHPLVMEALNRANRDHAIGYGDDPWTEEAVRKIREAFTPDCEPLFSLKKLERGGYIRRLVDQEDNRCNQICITDKGRKVVEDSVKIFRQMESRMFEGFSENDMKVLGELLDRIYGNLNQEFTDRAQGEES